jgi:hypothetical protein
MSLLQALCAGSPLWRGIGVNHEDERFVGELRIEPLLDGRAAMLRYRATLEDGSIAHEECTLLATAGDGTACLWPVMSELPVVLPHVERRDVDAPAGAVQGVFASGPRDDATAFREEITIALEATGTLRYAHAWGLPGEDFGDRSACRMAPCADDDGVRGR